MNFGWRFPMTFCEVGEREPLQSAQCYPCLLYRQWLKQLLKQTDRKEIIFRILYQKLHMLCSYRIFLQVDAVLKSCTIIAKNLRVRAASFTHECMGKEHSSYPTGRYLPAGWIWGFFFFLPAEWAYIQQFSELNSRHFFLPSMFPHFMSHKSSCTKQTKLILSAKDSLHIF